MIIDDKSAARRLESPMNLINKLKQLNNSNNKKNNAMTLFGIGRDSKKIEEVKQSFNPFQPKSSEQSEFLVEIPSTPPTENLDTILKNNESQIKLGLAHDKALDLLNAATSALALKLDDVRADKLPSVISAASKTVESIRRERSEAAKNTKDREVHYHFYTPEQKKVSDYEIIDVA